MMNIIRKIFIFLKERFFAFLIFCCFVGTYIFKIFIMLVKVFAIYFTVYTVVYIPFNTNIASDEANKLFVLAFSIFMFIYFCLAIVSDIIFSSFTSVKASFVYLLKDTLSNLLSLAMYFVVYILFNLMYGMSDSNSQQFKIISPYLSKIYTQDIQEYPLIRTPLLSAGFCLILVTFIFISISYFLKLKLNNKNMQESNFNDYMPLISFEYIVVTWITLSLVKSISELFHVDFSVTLNFYLFGGAIYTIVIKKIMEIRKSILKAKLSKIICYIDSVEERFNFTQDNTISSKNFKECQKNNLHLYIVYRIREIEKKSNIEYLSKLSRDEYQKYYDKYLSDLSNIKNDINSRKDTLDFWQSDFIIFIFLNYIFNEYEAFKYNFHNNKPYSNSENYGNILDVKKVK